MKIIVQRLNFFRGKVYCETPDRNGWQKRKLTL